MAITKAPAYGAVAKAAPKKIGGITIPPNIGYSGSGWNYPSAAVGGQTLKYSTTPGVAPQIVAPSSTFANVPNAQDIPNLQMPTMPQVDPSQYLSELTNDPLYQTGLSSYNSQVQANRNALTNALRQSVIQGGWAPGAGSGQVNLSNIGGQDFSGDIDQATIDAANANQMSDRAQLSQQLTRGLADIPSQLAARGATRSGAANIGAANLQNQYDVAANQALQNLAGAIGGNVSTWASNNANALSNWNATQGSIADRLAQIAQANAQAAYSNAMNDYNAKAGQANLGSHSITTAPSGPSPKTTSNVAKVKAAVVAKKAPKVQTTYGYTGSGWNYPGMRG